MIKRLFCLFLVLVIILVAVQAVSFLFPMRYKKEIQQYAKQNGLDPALIAAQIKVESNYDEQAVSRRGAVGRMQVLPSTGVWCAKEMQIQAYTDDMLTTPKINLQIGIWYDAYLLQQTKASNGCWRRITGYCQCGSLACRRYYSNRRNPVSGNA